MSLLARMLSYYDNYLDDHFIPEQYDVVSTGYLLFPKTIPNMIAKDSPGILWDTISEEEYSPYSNSIDELTAQQYMQIMKSKAESSLHAKLLVMAETKGYYNYSDNNNPAASNCYQRAEILRQYLSQFGMKEGTHYNITIMSGSTNQVKDFIIKKIDEGYPVLTSVGNEDGGHAVISYAHKGTDIYANMGWGGNSNAYYRLENSYDEFRNAMIIDFVDEYFPHGHSDNYQVIDYAGRSTNYCYCNCNILTYKNIGHIYMDHYEIYDSEQHKSYCRCDEYILENHTFKSDLVVWLNCKQCGFAKDSGGGGGDIICGDSSQKNINNAFWQ